MERKNLVKRKEAGNWTGLEQLWGNAGSKWEILSFLGKQHRRPVLYLLRQLMPLSYSAKPHFKFFRVIAETQNRSHSKWRSVLRKKDG